MLYSEEKCANICFSSTTAKISSRPGQSGRCDGYVLEGQELEFYVRKLKARK
jgi:hypothetical protein